MRYNGEFVHQQIDKIFFGFGFFPSDDPSRCLQESIDLLDRVSDTDVDSDFAPLTDKWRAHDTSRLYGEIAGKFMRNYPVAAEALFLHGWNKLGQKQLETKRRVYRAALANQLCGFYMTRGDKGAAIRWALYTQADDMLGQHEEGGGQGRKNLAGIFGMKNGEISCLNRIASENVDKITDSFAGDWSNTPGFPEDVIRRFAVEMPQCAHLFAEESYLNEFPLSQPYFCALRGQVDAIYEKGREKEKGDALEKLASYLFLLIPGWMPRRNLYGESLSSETDIVVRNVSRPCNLSAELFGRHFLVECKNWEKPVRVQQVGYFLYRMRLTHAKFGVIFAKSGISGDQTEETASHALIRKAFHEDGSICIIVTNEDLERLTDEQSFWPILLERSERLRFGEPRSS